MKNPRIRRKKMSELQYGDRYILVNDGGVFAGGWDDLIDCFGIDSETIDEWCEFHDYTYKLKLYDSADKLLNEMTRLYRKLRNDMVPNSRFDEIADELKLSIQSFEKDTY